VSWREPIARLDRVQKSPLFKIIASGVIVAAAVVLLVTLVVLQRGGAAIPALEMLDQAATAPEPIVPEPDAAPEEVAAAQAAAAERTALQATRQMVGNVLSARDDQTGLVVLIAGVAGVMLAVVWLGLGLTFLALGLFVAAVAFPLGALAGWRGAATLLTGVGALAAAFSALSRLLRLGLGGSSGVLSVARNTVDEALRGRVGVVFVVILLFLIAGIPLRLDPESPLRYRVQAFLSQGTGIAYGILGLFTVLFAVATVTFEQRDRIIWQTMTKPVAPWQYLLGKWLGVVGLNAVLLGVCATGVFLFTEHLRGLPAVGEVRAFVPRDAGVVMSEDRVQLETQVLSANRKVQADGPRLDQAQFDASVEARLQAQKDANPLFEPTDQDRRLARAKLFEELVQAFRTIEPGAAEYYRFSGLSSARDRGTFLTLRYRINAGANEPDQFYRVTFVAAGQLPIMRQSGLNQLHTITIPSTLIDEEGNLDVMVINGDPQAGVANPKSITLAPDGFSISYPAAGFRGNFLRVVAVLWIKLAFLAMIGLVAGTFLSFPVAALVGLGAFAVAEAAPFIRQSLESFSFQDREGNTLIFNSIAGGIARGVAWVFQIYGDLRPVESLVQGELLAWSTVARSLSVLGAVCAALYAAGCLIFSRRELATYSGH
jgi:hypothetical protein